MKMLSKSFQKHPDFFVVQKVYHTLRQAGYQVLLAGGCVRDGLLGVVPKDFDLATEASPDEVEKLFSKTIAVGKAFGVILVLESGVQIEVATFRRDGPYQDGRRPQSVVFCSAQEDALRRDFTVNALFYDLIEEKIIDYVDGQADLKKKIIRAVGAPDQRFQEDHLRILRAIRFVGQLGFAIEAETWKSIQGQVGLIVTVSGERLHEEIQKLLSSQYLLRGLALLIESQILQKLFPEMIFKLSNWQASGADAAVGWIDYWIWVWKSSEGTLNRSQLSTYLVAWKFSKKDREQIERSLTWYLYPQQFEQMTEGEIIEKIYDDGYSAGLNSFIKDHTGYQGRYQQILSKKKDLGEQLPNPMVRALDIEASFKGVGLGSALRKVYWAQLEGVVKSKAEGLEFLGIYK